MLCMIKESSALRAWPLKTLPIRPLRKYTVGQLSWRLRKSRNLEGGKLNDLVRVSNLGDHRFSTLLDHSS